MSKRKIPSIENVFDSDVSYVTLMNNKELIHDITKYIIKEAEDEKNQPKGRYVFGGNFILGEDVPGVHSQDLTPLVDEYTIDLISPNVQDKPSRNPTRQGTYKTLKDWFKLHKPEEKQCTIYFIGQPHAEQGNTKNLDIHWNCFIVDRVEHRIIWYDPSESISGGVGYNFDYGLKLHVKQTIRDICAMNFPILTALTTERAQQSCNPEYLDADIFCQTWVIFFASSWINGCFPTLVSLPFSKLTNFPLKLWMKCIISRLDAWKSTFKRNEFSLFQKFQRQGTWTEQQIHYKVEELPAPIKQKCDPKPCIYSVLTHLLKLDHCYKKGDGDTFLAPEQYLVDEGPIIDNEMRRLMREGGSYSYLTLLARELESLQRPQIPQSPERVERHPNRPIVRGRRRRPRTPVHI